jgi:hypothetical protein
LSSSSLFVDILRVARLGAASSPASLNRAIRIHGGCLVLFSSMSGEDAHLLRAQWCGPGREQPWWWWTDRLKRTQGRECWGRGKMRIVAPLLAIVPALTTLVRSHQRCDLPRLGTTAHHLFQLHLLHRLRSAKPHRTDQVPHRRSPNMISRTVAKVLFRLTAIRRFRGHHVDCF